MTLPEFWLTVLSSVIGAGIGAAIAYYFGNMQIKKQISESRRIVEVQFKLNILTTALDRINNIYSNDFFELQSEKVNLTSTTNSNNLISYIHMSAQYLTYIRQILISLEKYIEDNENNKQLHLLKDSLALDHDNIITAGIDYNKEKISKEKLLNYYDDIFERINEKITETQVVIRKEEERLLESLR